MPGKGAKGSSANDSAHARRGSNIPLQYASAEAVQCFGPQRLSSRATSPQYTIPASGASAPLVRRRRSQHDVPIQYAPDAATRSAGKQRLSIHPTSPMFSFFGAHGPAFTAAAKKDPKKEERQEEVPPIPATGLISDAFSSRHRRPQGWKWHAGTCLSPAEEAKRNRYSAPRIQPGFEYNKANYQGKFEGKLHFAMALSERFESPMARGSEQRPVTPGPGAYVYDVRVPSRGTRKLPVPYSTLGRSRLESQYPSAPTPTFPPPGHPYLKPQVPTMVTQHSDWRDHPDRWTKSIRTAWSEGHDAYDESFWGY